MLLGDKVMPSKNYKSLLSDGEEDVVFCGESTVYGGSYTDSDFLGRSSLWR